MAFNPGSGTGIANAGDVALSNPADEQVLGYSAAMGKWRNQAFRKPVMNVKDYGAKGDGLVDDTSSIQAAVTAIGAAGGGVLFFPAGEYRVLGYVLLVSNMEIFGSGATIRKSGATSTYCVFIGLSGNRLGYGGGVQNISLHDLHFRGDLTNSKSLNAMSLHRASHIRVRDCTFYETTQNGHVFDLQGCDDVIVEGCEFRGIKVVGGREYVENIQLDASVSTGTGFPSVLVAQETFDGIPTKNVTVRDCIFGGIQVGATFYPSACPLGSHSYVEGTYYENITFENNVVENVIARGASYYGMLHFLGGKGIKVLNNTFDAQGIFNTAVRCYRGANAIAFADVNNANASTITPQEMSVPKDIQIQGNNFKNFTSATSANIVEVFGSSLANPGMNLTISGNIFNDNFPDGVVTGDIGAGCIYVSYARNVLISNNHASRMRKFYFVGDAQNVTSVGNSVQYIATNPLMVEDCINTTQTGNTIMYQAQPCYVNRGSNHVVGQNTHTNFVAVDSVNGRAWVMAATTGCLFSANIINTASSAANGVEFRTAAGKNSVTSNIIQGFAVAVVALDTSTLDIYASNLTA
jgi:hypothetical protein